ncbi:hypothetical protein [Corallococcus terminator]|uniref:Uncharacterized protein n=1 Tax=Corallococcus terminator TaxID=2316733 RepID=A0A3A8JD51_9BACT|nr:hypothetical protein [Corallococcus terminator]RKG93652.1 hypothetical protein D7V88_01540 [Corallococcus terminator]
MSLSSSKSPRTAGVRRAAPLAGLAVFSLLVAPVAQAAPTPEARSRASVIPTTLAVACLTGSSTITYNPGLTNTPQNVTSQTNSSYSLCLNLIGLPLTLAAGSGSGDVAIPNASCGGALNLGSGLQETFYWSDGADKFTTVQFNQITLEPGQGNTVATRTGTVVSGRFKGAVAVKATTYVNAQGNQACNAPGGLTSISGPSTLTLAFPTP